mmetsp:Transcript_1351/g.2741  ORF Transcript_1351/g.2741 Transcript_1351/m.2741 type:complete len:294 (+) Transcript_1351:354-1235(+)
MFRRHQLLIHRMVVYLSVPPRRPIVRNMMHVCGPSVQTVKNVRRVDDSRPPRLALLLQPHQQIPSNAHVQARRHLVQQQHLERPHKRDQNLHPPPLSVRQLVHPPLRIDHEHVHELVPTLGMGILKFGHHAAYGHVGHEGDGSSHEGDVAQAPIHVEVGAEVVELRGAEGVHAQDGHGHRVFGALVHQVAPGKDAEEGRFAGAVGADQETSAAGCELDVDVTEDVHVAGLPCLSHTRTAYGVCSTTCGGVVAEAHIFDHDGDVAIWCDGWYCRAWSGRDGVGHSRSGTTARRA